MIKINKLAGRWQSFIIGTVGLIGTLVTGGNEAVFAQVIPDDTLGAESSVVNPDAIIRDILSNRIEGGATRGANLFHSFIEFNVAEGRGIYFANPDGIENILSRVTGDNVSNILGRLGVLGEANLFLLNPNGILFGENASLDIEGSFVATTASGIELGEDGVFSATQPRSSRLLSVSPGALFYNAVEAAGGKITNRGNLTTGRNLTLDGENLDLQGQLRSGSDLTLFAQDNVKVRDSVATPFLAQAGGNLTIQGNGGIDIWALNHPTQTPFVSGGDLSLRSDGIISGDARFASGGSFLIQSVSGGLANFVSLNDPIISATGNVDVVGEYTGASLLVEATGNIRFQGGINITGPDTSELPDGPDTETLSTSTALIVRSGQDALAYGGVNSGSVPAYSTTDVPEGITIGGDVVLQPFNGVGGIVNLEAASGNVSIQGVTTNGGAIDIYSAGEITTNGQTLDSRNGMNDGGEIRLEASNGSIYTGMLRSNSSSFFQAGNGGGIRLESSDGIHIRGSLFSSSWSFLGNAGHGGDINLSATNDITITDDLYANSSSFNSTSNGGKISIFTANGSISVGNLRSNSYSFVTGGNGGDINLSAAKDITTGGLFSEAGGAGNGGNITLTSTAGEIDATRGNVMSQIRDDSGGTGNAGTIIFTARGDIRTANLNASAELGNGSLIQLTSTNGAIDTTRGFLATDSRSGNAGEVKLNAFDNITTGRINSFSRGSGNGGAISIITTSGNIFTNTLNSRSISSGSTGNGGTIRLESGDEIHIRSSLFSDSWSNSGNAGNGGNINLSAANDITIDDHAYAYSLSFDGTAANGGTISLVSANGNVSTGSLSSDSRSDSESAANGGAINISATNGSISSTGYLLSASNSNSGVGGNGGAITLEAGKDITIARDVNARSNSSYGNAGDGGTIRIDAGNNINIADSVNSFSSSESGNAGNGGAIRIEAANDIKIARDISARSISDYGNAGDGGLISLLATNGNISTGGFNSSSYSELGLAGNGSEISLKAPNGNIFTSFLSSYSRSLSAGSGGNGGGIHLEAGNSINIDRARSFSSNDANAGQAGKGGTINLEATEDINIADRLESYSRSVGGIAVNGGTIHVSSSNGNIATGYIDSSSLSFFRAGNGGDISLIARGGDIIGDSSNSFLYSYSFALPEGEAGSGGNVTLEAQNNLTNLEILTPSPTSSGDVVINGFDNLSVTNTRILTSKLVKVDVEVPFSTTPIILDSTTPIILDVGGQGQSGDVTVTSSGNLTFNSSSIESDTHGSGRAGNVTVSSLGLITFNNSQIISNTSNIGDAGDIAVDAGGGITFQGLYSYQGESQRGGLFAGTTNQGFAGNITLTTPELNLQNGANIATTTASSGDAGSIILQSHPNTNNLNINLEEDTSISASTSNEGTGGNLRIIAPDSVTIQGEGNITTETTDAGKAGNIEITSTNLDIQQTQLSTSTTGTGNAGDITLDTSTLTVARGAEIFALTNGSGDSGTITVNATTAVNLGIGVNDFSPVLSVETSNAGKAGSIIINTPTLTLSDTARITATATNTATNTEGGGSISLNASTMNLAGIVGVFAETQGQTPAGTLTLKPYQDQSTLNLTLAPQSRISASTSGSGKGGNLEVSAPEAITIRGQGELAVETTGEGAAGNLTIDTQRLTIADGASISASTSSPNPSGVGGNITINATESFNLTNQASLLAQSTGAAKAGNVTINTEQLTAENGSITTSATATSLGEGGSINVNASQINLKGTEIGLLAETEGVAPAGALTLQPFENGQNLTINLQDNAKISAATSGSGEGGSLSVTAPESITIRGQGQLSVETTGDGAAGDLTIDTQNLTITDGATISASTDSANPDGLGGSLTINATESFTLTNQARLLAQSTGAAPAGTITVDTGQLTANNGSIETSATQSAGGAITITASDIRLFGDSDIRTDVASGVGGGGNITLTADTILAFADSDILAFAQDGKGGDITFNTPVFFGFAYAPAPKGTDPDTLDHNDRVDINATGAVEGVITLPDDSAVRNSLTPLSTNQIDTDKLIAESCIARRHEPQRGSFFITGTGGIPFRPGDLYDTPYQTGTVRSIPSEGDGEAGGEFSSSTRRPWKIGDPIIEPTGIYRLANGKVIMSRLCGE
ncbi:two-partner secretion domain-containing protein [Coleofasciculus sp. E1-EBD-02]|uniref:two-partner secretion domain-containing protein n=1 Tax=Coleofasciculus sp. E1-EBD-02 TaxID=3068481 RepID=UPI0032FD788C